MIYNLEIKVHKFSLLEVLQCWIVLFRKWYWYELENLFEKGLYTTFCAMQVLCRSLANWQELAKNIYFAWMCARAWYVWLSKIQLCMNCIACEFVREYPNTRRLQKRVVKIHNEFVLHGSSCGTRRGRKR